MIIFSLAYPWSRGKNYEIFSSEIELISLWPTRRAWAELSPKTPSSVPGACAVISMLCNEVFPYCSSGSSRYRESWHCVALKEKVADIFISVVFWRLNFLHSLFLSVVLFFAVLQGNILQVCTSNLGEKMSKDTCLAEDNALSLGWEDKNGGRGQRDSARRQCDSVWADWQ